MDSLTHNLHTIHIFPSALDLNLVFRVLHYFIFKLKRIGLYRCKNESVNAMFSYVKTNFTPVRVCKHRSTNALVTISSMPSSAPAGKTKKEKRMVND